MMELLIGPLEGAANAVLMALLAFTTRATVILLGAWGVTRLLRSASAATRHLVWTAAIVGVLSLPLLSFVLPAWTVPVVSLTVNVDAPVAEVASAAGESAEPAAAAPRASIIQSTPVSPVPAARSEAAGHGGASRWPLPAFSIETQDVVAAAWLAIAALLIVRLAIANARVLAWRRTSQLVEDTRWNNLLRRLTREHDIERPVVLLENASTDVPVTWGIVYPVVLLPAASVEWDEEQRLAVLTHELAHVKRFDALSQMLAQLALALLWFHPLAWLAVRRMRLEREHACDDFVLVAGARASRYADDLLGLARRLARPTVPAAAALAMARRSELEGRLLAILDPTAKRTAVRGARVGLLTVAVLVLAMPLAAFRPAARMVTQTRPAVAEVAQAPAPAAEASRRAEDRGASTSPGSRLPGVSSPDSSLPVSLKSDTALSGMLEAMLRIPLNADSIPAMLPRLAQAVGVPAIRIPTDTEPAARPVEVQTLVEVARGAKRMTSDYEKGQLLAQVAKRYVRNDSVRDAYLDAVFSMSSDYERQKALVALLERDSIPASHTARVLRSAALMSSDHSRSLVLRKISPATFSDSTVQRAYLGVISAMSSNYDRANAIGVLVKHDSLPVNVQLGLLRTIGAISGSTEKAGVLLLFLTHQGTADPAVRQTFLKTAETLSDSEYRRVMTAMMR